MINGDLAPFWLVVDKRAPSDVDFIIERMFTQEDDIRSVEQVRQMLTRELIDFRVPLATYASAPNDMQRKEIIDLALFVSAGNGSQGVGQIAMRFDPVEFTCFNQGGDDGPVLCASIMTCKECVASCRKCGVKAALT